MPSECARYTACMSEFTSAPNGNTLYAIAAYATTPNDSTYSNAIRVRKSVFVFISTGPPLREVVLHRQFDPAMLRAFPHRTERRRKVGIGERADSDPDRAGILAGVPIQRRAARAEPERRTAAALAI